MSKASTPRSPRGRNRSKSVPSAEEQRPSEATQKPAKRDWAAYKRQQREKRIAELTQQLMKAGHRRRKAEQLAADAFTEERRVEQRRRRARVQFPRVERLHDGSLRLPNGRTRYSSVEEIKRVLGLHVCEPAQDLPFEPRYLWYYAVAALRRAATWTPLALFSREEIIGYAHFTLLPIRDCLLPGRFRDRSVQSVRRYAWDAYPVIAQYQVRAPQVAIEWASAFTFLSSLVDLTKSVDANHPHLKTLAAYSVMFGTHLYETTQSKRPKLFFLTAKHIDSRFTYDGYGLRWALPPRPEWITRDFLSCADWFESSMRSAGGFHVPPEPTELPMPIVEHPPLALDDTIPFTLPNFVSAKDKET